MVIEQTSVSGALNFVKSELKKDFQGDIYQNWFEEISLLSEEGDHIVLGVPNDFAAIWINDNYKDMIAKKLQMVLGKSLKITLKPDDNSNTPPLPPKIEENVVKNLVNEKTYEIEDGYVLNPKNTFENFVVGSGNQMAHAASIAIANAPGKAYNPLFLYGATGLGKTHLMHAVAHQILSKNRKVRVVYTSTEKFTNEFIQAIQLNTMAKFRKKYRSIDVFLLDDIHFLSGKERIQEEFFYTFNELFEAQKQIFLCSDRPASEISKLESRLVSRFQWGLVTDIQPPDLETRIAILAKKANDLKIVLDSSVLSYLAEHVSSSVRRLEGALIRVASYMELTKAKVDIPILKMFMKDLFQEETTGGTPSLDIIQQKVAEFYSLKTADLLGKRRPANIAMARQIAMYLGRTLTAQSLVDIGLAFGGRDHGTVIYACKSVENMMEQDEIIKRNVDHLRKILRTY
ncbi:MAG: chromosomal replication initiator protein DnaA [Puniceicoccales bacterium]|jgi:chromosomal replication initiator protein|nr:chromosomal replication initiator protein DnaA [Puniceicoccales bacterium]